MSIYTGPASPSRLRTGPASPALPRTGKAGGTRPSSLSDRNETKRSGFNRYSNAYGTSQPARPPQQPAPQDGPQRWAGGHPDWVGSRWSPDAFIPPANSQPAQPPGLPTPPGGDWGGGWQRPMNGKGNAKGGGRQPPAMNDFLASWLSARGGR